MDYTIKKALSPIEIVNVGDVCIEEIMLKNVIHKTKGTYHREVTYQMKLEVLKIINIKHMILLMKIVDFSPYYCVNTKKDPFYYGKHVECCTDTFHTCIKKNGMKITKYKMGHEVVRNTCMDDWKTKIRESIVFSIKKEILMLKSHYENLRIQQKQNRMLNDSDDEDFFDNLYKKPFYENRVNKTPKGSKALLERSVEENRVNTTPKTRSVEENNTRENNIREKRELSPSSPKPDEKKKKLSAKEVYQAMLLKHGMKR